MRRAVLKRKRKKHVVSARKAHQGCKCWTDNGVRSIYCIGQNDDTILWMLIRNASNEKQANWGGIQVLYDCIGRRICDKFYSRWTYISKITATGI
eukprot:1032758-Ditylum_brightwellii.AAC.1